MPFLIQVEVGRWPVLMIRIKNVHGLSGATIIAKLENSTTGLHAGRGIISMGIQQLYMNLRVLPLLTRHRFRVFLVECSLPALSALRVFLMTAPRVFLIKCSLSAPLSGAPVI